MTSHKNNPDVEWDLEHNCYRANIIGKTISDKLILNEVDSKTEHRKYLVKCIHCGTERVRSKHQLKVTCICVKRKIRDEKIKASKFGKLTPIEAVSGEGNDQYWKMKCECGKEKVIPISPVQSGKTKSCGCLCKENSFKIGDGEANFNVLYSIYQKNAKSRNIQFLLEKDRFRELTKQNCYICGRQPETIINRKKSNGKYIYNGIDRIDNNKGYTYENCKACCETCNVAKWKQTTKDFLEWVKKVYIYQGLNNE